MGFSTLGTETKRKIKHSESHLIAEGYVCKVAIDKGAVVKLDPTTNEVEPISAAADVPFGVITKGTTEAASGQVTVATEYSAVVKGIANGVIAIGNEVTAVAYDTVNKQSNYLVSATTNYVTGVALTAAVATEDVWVGILRSFRVKP